MPELGKGIVWAFNWLKSLCYSTPQAHHGKSNFNFDIGGGGRYVSRVIFAFGATAKFVLGVKPLINFFYDFY